MNDSTKKYFSSPKGKIALAKAMRKMNSKLKVQAYHILGDKCIRCGFSDIRALQIDHINGGGCKELKKLTSPGVYRKVIKYATGYQLLCANCNWIKRFENHENNMLLYD